MAKKHSVEWWQAQRPEVVGKETEKLVEDVLKEQNKQSTFSWHRFPDARSARGALAAQPADYLLVDTGRTYFVECKAIKHEYRLPKDRVSQLPTLKKFQMAGACALVLVHHYMTGKWRLVNVSHLDIGQPSWDLSLFPTFDSPYQALFGSAA